LTLLCHSLSRSACCPPSSNPKPQPLKPTTLPPPQATNLAKALPISASTTAQPEETAVSDLGVVAISVDGCTRKSLNVTLDGPPALTVVKEHEWALAGGAAPAVLVAKPGERFDANFTLKASS
jgi:hypothetical protein